MSAAPIALDQLEAAHWLVVGTTGSGKTYLARGLLEQLRRADRRVGVVDKMGKMWGLTLSADGTGPGLEFVIFGGKRAQAPMTPDQGALIGRLFVERNLPAIFDLSQWKATDQERWVADFCNAVFAANETALHLMFDEAQSWVPQGAGGPAYEAVRLLAEQGRGNGINLLLTAPRMAGLDANVRGAIGAMVAMRQTLDIDIKRTAETIGAHFPVDDKAFKTQLPTLPTGTGYIWSPTGSGLERVAFPANSTFDSSRTPRHGDTPPPPIAISSTLIDELRAALAPPAEPESQKSGYRDPTAIDQEQLQLRSDLSAAEVEIDRLQGIIADQRAELEHLRGVDAECEDYSRGLTAIEELVLAVRSGTYRANLHSRDADLQMTPPSVPVRAEVALSPPPDNPDRYEEAARTQGVRGMSALQVLVSAAPGNGLTEEQWAFVGGFSRLGGTWTTYKGALRSAGLIEQLDGRWSPTQAGYLAAADAPINPPSLGPELVRTWAKKGQSTGKLPEVLLEAWPYPITRETLAAHAGMTASGGTFTTYLGRLRKRGMLEEHGKQIRLNPALMEWQ